METSKSTIEKNESCRLHRSATACQRLVNVFRRYDVSISLFWLGALKQTPATTVATATRTGKLLQNLRLRSRMLSRAGSRVYSLAL